MLYHSRIHGGQIDKIEFGRRNQQEQNDGDDLYHGGNDIERTSALDTANVDENDEPIKEQAHNQRRHIIDQQTREKYA